MKTINVEFVGGLLDGQVLHGDSVDPEEAKLAKKCFWGTKEGNVGTRFPGLSAQEMHLLRKRAAAEHHFEGQHDYVVAVRLETDKEIRVKLECVGGQGEKTT